MELTEIESVLLQVPGIAAAVGAYPGLEMFRRLLCASSSIRPTPPSRTVLVEARAKPLTCWRWGGSESAFGSVRTSTSVRQRLRESVANLGRIVHGAGLQPHAAAMAA
jgi:hypothetical protein